MADLLEDLLRDCTVRVTGGPMPGTGFFVAPGKVLTCVHVIGDSAALVVRWERDGHLMLELPVSGRIATLADRGRPIPALDRDYPDIAVLEVDGLEGHPCVDIDREWPSRGDSFLVFGYPMEGGAVQLTPARLNYRGTHGTQPTAYLDLASDTIKPGMSGAALLNLSSGAVCGVVVASKHPAHPEGALAIPWAAIAADLGGVLTANRAFQLGDRRWDEAAAEVPGYRGKIVGYLRALIDWLGRDPWPQDQRFRGPVLTPAAIERKLRVTVTGREGERHLDVDDLARQCQRLVILGGPGSGKTWLAKRTARRCAEDALKALVAGGTVNGVELPLYTTCSRLFSAGGDIRNAAVSSALDQLGDLGGSRSSAALRAFFADRGSPTLLVIDSLDEAHGPDERLRQADTLPWRIVLTSRPNSWNHQLVIEKGDDSHRVGELQPLRYPDDVEPFIRRWFAGQLAWGKDLAAQIARRPGLQQAATVPLILAFYCIIGGDKPLPEFRRDLYTMVLKRILSGSWRGNDDHKPDVDICLQTLRAWAWSGATSHPVSGIGTWADDIPTHRGPLDHTGEGALDHIAPPLGPPDVDSGTTLRRFIHRSIREHLVAEHVASLPVDQAADALLPHLWHDPDWEYSAPAALAAHPQRDQLLRDLMWRAAYPSQTPGLLSINEGGGEFQRLLARVATESSEPDWAPVMAAIIGHARVALAGSHHNEDLSGTGNWTSNRYCCDKALRLLAGPFDWHTISSVAFVVRLFSTAEDKRQARDAILGLLSRQLDGSVAEELVGGLVQLDPTPEDKRQARDVLVGFLTGQLDGSVATKLVGELVQLVSTDEDRRQARHALLGGLADQTHADVAAWLVGGLVQLDPTPEDKRQARDALLGLLPSRADSLAARASISGLVQLVSTAEDKRQARNVLLGLLRGGTPSWVVKELLGGLIQLVSTAEDKRQAAMCCSGCCAAGLPVRWSKNCWAG